MLLLSSFVVLAREPKALRILGKCSTTQLNPSLRHRCPQGTQAQFFNQPHSAGLYLGTWVWSPSSASDTPGVLN